MKATFDFGGDPSQPGHMDAPSYQLTICFDGRPGIVMLEVERVLFNGYSGASGDPVTEQRSKRETVMRAPLEASHARAIASALLSAATEVRRNRDES